MTDDRAIRPDILETQDGERLEAAWSGSPDADAVAVLTHPHPRFGGDMHNAVPAGLARALPDHGIATLRFNFRGTGGSTGSHGGGDAEIGDVRAAVDAAVRSRPGVDVVAIGYSFGADVLLALDDPRLRAVVAIAPPLSTLSAKQFAEARGSVPTLVLAAQHDQFRAADEAEAMVAEWPQTTFFALAGADHHLAGMADRVHDRVLGFLRPILRTG